VNALEQDALEVLDLVRSLKNSLAPINKIPPEVLSLVPDYFDEDWMDENLIALTHVCRGWRDAFISRSSLWTRLYFTNVDKTHTYIQRSRTSPLEFHIYSHIFLHNAFYLAILHLHRLKSLLVITSEREDTVLEYFHYHAPLLEELDIDIRDPNRPAFDNKLFNGDLSSLRKLSLSGVMTDLPWRNLANLRAVSLGFYAPNIGITQFLDFFESAPLLRTVEICDSIPGLSDASPKRMVALPHLTTLRINADRTHATLLDHLSIPAGASLLQEFDYRGEESPLLDYLPKKLANLGNLSHITSIYLCLDFASKILRMSGPSGELRMIAHCKCLGSVSYNVDHRILRDLGLHDLSTTQRLSFSKYKHLDSTEEVFQILSLAKNRRTLVLAECNNLPFLFALDPRVDSYEPLLCPNLEELVLYIEPSDQSDMEQLINMAENRAARGVKLPSVTIVGLDELELDGEVLLLKGFVPHVEYRVGDVPPDLLMDGDEGR
jgi:hypothetical protein